MYAYIFIIFFSFDEYYKLGKWTSENCSDPQNLFESIVSKLEDVVGHTSYEYFDTKKDTIKIETKDLAKEWQAYDNADYGRCFTLSPSKKHTQYRIRSSDGTGSLNPDFWFGSPLMDR